MLSVEFGILLILGGILAISGFLFPRQIRTLLLVALLACPTGYVAQLALGPDLNAYTPNITLYMGYVSIAAILTWGCGLTVIYAFHLLAARWLRRRPGFRLFMACTVPAIVMVEIVGSHVLRMKLRDHRQYASVLPPLQIMHAPPWLYLYYGLIAILFYFLLRALSLHRCGQES